jgi:YggT family protein
VIAWNNLILFVISTLQEVLGLYSWIVLIAVLLTWIEPNPYNPIVRFLYSVTEPVFDLVREHIPVVFGGIDLSPIIVFIAIRFVQQVVLTTLAQYLLVSGSPAFG